MKFAGTQLPKEKAAEFYNILGELRALQKKPVLDRCMYWSGACDDAPIGSHLLARSWLQQIADNTNHVLQLHTATENLCNKPAEIIPRRLGVNIATTFPGFCKKHDDEIFACLEKSEFVATKEQLTALRYRSLCREACAKYQIVSGNLQRALDHAAPPDFTSHVIAEMKRFMLLLKETTKEAFQRNNVQSYVIKFAKRPTVLVSATIHPFFTFTGRVLESRPEWITVSIIPSENCGWAIFSWSGDAPKNASLMIKSFRSLPEEKQTVALLYLLFEVSENHAISPEWWHSLGDRNRQNLVNRFGRTSLWARGSAVPANLLVVSEKPWIDWQPIEAYYA